MVAAKILKAKAVCLSASILVGCAMGSSKYSCKGRPGSPLCRSAAEVYEMTHEKDRLVTLEIEGQKKASKSNRASLPQPQPTIPVEDPMPIRTPAKVMRIWIAPWEDEDGDLIASGYVYTEIEPRRWQIGTQQAAHESRVIEPLNPKSPVKPLLPVEASPKAGAAPNRDRSGNRPTGMSSFNQPIGGKP